MKILRNKIFSTRKQYEESAKLERDLTSKENKELQRSIKEDHRFIGKSGQSVSTPSETKKNSTITTYDHSHSSPMDKGYYSTIFKEEDIEKTSPKYKIVTTTKKPRESYREKVIDQKGNTHTIVRSKNTIGHDVTHVINEEGTLFPEFYNSIEDSELEKYKTLERGNRTYIKKQRKNTK